MNFYKYPGTFFAECTMTSFEVEVPSVSKKYGVENYNILQMVQYINVIFLRNGNYNFHLGVCTISIQYVKGN